MSADAINALIEAVWTVVLLLSVRRLLADRALKGISVAHVALIVVTSWWFIYYYAALDQWWSFASAIVYAAACLLWVGVMLKLWRDSCVQGSDTNQPAETS